jgi:competence protein ComFC
MSILNPQRFFSFFGLKKGSSSISPRTTLLPSDLNVTSLKGIFDFGFTLDQHSHPIDSNHKRTKIGEVVYRYKYRFEKELCFPLANMVSETVQSNAILHSAEFILTVPPSFASRPFDSISVLAEEIAKKIYIPYQKDILERTKITRLQKHLFVQKDKIENVKGAFRVKNPALIKGKKILLIDDIYDSGATLNEIFRILKTAGASKVFVLTLTQTKYGWSKQKERVNVKL